MEAAKVPQFIDENRVWRADEVDVWVKSEVEKVMDARSVADEIGGDRLRKALDHHLARIPLLRG